MSAIACVLLGLFDAGHRQLSGGDGHALRGNVGSARRVPGPKVRHNVHVRERPGSQTSRCWLRSPTGWGSRWWLITHLRPWWLRPLITVRRSVAFFDEVDRWWLRPQYIAGCVCGTNKVHQLPDASAHGPVDATRPDHGPPRCPRHLSKTF